MQPRLYRDFIYSFALAVASSASIYSFIWGLDTTHPELGIPSGAALTFAIYLFPIALLAGMAIVASRHAGHRRH